MITFLTFGIGFVLILAGILLTSGEEDKRYLILLVIGVIIIMIGVGLIIGNELDCRNYCRCKGYEYYEQIGNKCECSYNNPIITRASNSCVNSCSYSKQAYYDQATGRCYCT